MKSPFQFGRVVTGDAFTNRKDEIKRLTSNIENNVHTTLISPRRWGKSSLVKQTQLNLASQEGEIKFCFIDLFKIRNEEDFYSTYAKAVIKATSSKAEEWISLTKTFLSKISPNITFGADPFSDFEINFDVKGVKQNYEDILNLPEKIAKKRGITITICIDEFQNLGNFDEPVLLQKRLRSVWQYHQKVTYILYGSKRHMLMHLFENKSMPFYKFGEVIYLEKIAEKHLRGYIKSAFANTGKTAGDEHARRVAQYVQCHPYYTQQLAHLVWINTEDEVTDEILENAVLDLLSQNAIVYQAEIDSLTNAQINFLKAVAGGSGKLSSGETIRKYKLGSSANVSRIKKSLEKKEIVEILNKKAQFIDPAFELWFKKYYLD